MEEIPNASIETEECPIKEPQNNAEIALPVIEEAVLSIADLHEEAYQEQVKKRRLSMHANLIERTDDKASYFATTDKERKVWDYVENFDRQYQLLFPHRRALLLNMPNEYQSIKELYDYTGCARFVADYMTYLPLDPPHELPATIPSPTYTLAMQEGNSFDLSILLTSLLCGVGYDAYVVSGYATQEITLVDSTKTDTSQMEMLASALGFYSNFTRDTAGDFWMTGEEEGNDQPPHSNDYADVILAAVGAKNDTDTDAASSKYKFKTPKALVSQFVLKQERKRVELELRIGEKKRTDSAKEKAKLSSSVDELKGQRVHAWVLVLAGKREVAEAFYIETSTGDIYSTDSPYILGIESVFNFANYWVNMQPGTKNISLDLGDNTKWEFVLLNNTQPGALYSNERDDDDGDKENKEILDLPRSWVNRITLSQENFQARCPSGSKTIEYRNAKLEMFAEYHREDGMVARISRFADKDLDLNEEIREIFRNRRDKLWQRVKTPNIDQVHEFFEPGRSHGLKHHIIVADKTKEMDFYSSARSDGMIKRIEGLDKVIEHYTGRDDYLVYRSASYESPRADGEGKVPFKTAEKFNRDAKRQSHEDAAKRTFYLNEDRMKVLYHLEDGYIIPSYLEFRKPSADQKGSLDLISAFEANPNRSARRMQDLYALLHDTLRGEHALSLAIKSTDRQISELIQTRHAEEKDIILAISVFDTIRNKTKLPDEEEKETHRKDKEDDLVVALDYLSPFLVDKQTPEKLNKEEATTVRDACLKSMKERVLEKTGIIQSRLDEVSMEYQQRKLAYSRSSDTMSVDETEDYVKYCNSAMFKIHILEKRMAAHKESVPQRYLSLDTKLHSEKRLAAAYL